MSAGEAAPDCAPPPARPASEPARAEAAPPTLIVPDGNWNQAKHMVRRLLRARPISCLTLPDAVDRGRLHLRERPHSGHRSTLEAIAAALALLEGAEVEARLLAVYDDFVQRVASTSGRFRVRP